MTIAKPEQLSLLDSCSEEGAIARAPQFSTGAEAAPPEGSKSFPQSYVTPPLSPSQRLHKTRQPLQTYRRDGVTYQLEKIHCGKPNCKSCPHGPYWYAYWKSSGKTRSKYIGKRLPWQERESDSEQNAQEPAN